MSQYKTHQSSKKNNKKDNRKISVYLYPILFIICIIPFVVRLAVYNPGLSGYSWFPNVTTQSDFFLYYKQWLFVTASIIMACIIAAKAFMDKKSLQVLPIFITLAMYGVLCLLSAMFSENRSFSFSGGLEQFESVLVLLGYCLVVYYVFLFIRDEQDMRIVITFFVCAVLVMGIFMLFQFLGYDFYKTDFAQKLMIPEKYRSGKAPEFNFEKGRIFGPFYNPNYVGSYTALVIPILIVLLTFQRKLHGVVLYVLAVAGLVVAIAGSRSLTGVIGLAISALMFIILMRRYLLKRFYITVPALLAIVLLFLYMGNKLELNIIERLQALKNIQKTEYALTSLETKDEYVSLVFAGSELRVSYSVDEYNNRSYKIMNSEGNLLNFRNDNGVMVSLEERFPGITIGPHAEFIDVFYIQAEGITWSFVKRPDVDTYYYINAVDKLDKIYNAPSAVFTGYEALASARGYLWSRTIPLIKKNIILGAGPDNFVMEFPQQDYLGGTRAGYVGITATKPHNMYLQIAIQTGLLSLLAFLTFYGIYFVTSIKLYIKGRFNSYYSQVGVAIFLGSIAYMITGLANDSSITTAPIFWTMMGIGILANHKAKPLILAETEQLKK